MPKLNPKLTPLTKEQEKLLVATNDEDLLHDFPGYPRKWLRNQKRALVQAGVRAPEDEPEAQEMRQALDDWRGRFAESRSKRDLRKALKYIHELEDALDAQRRIFGHDTETRIIKPPTSNISARHPVVCCTSWSDWHIEEEIDMPGLNTFNLEVAQARADRLAQNFVQLVQRTETYVGVEHILINLNGDGISGNIHTDCIANALLPPIDASLKLLDMYVAALTYVAEKLKQPISVVTSCGNHSRITGKEKLVANAHGNSLEWFVYNALHDRFALTHPDRFQWNLSRTYYTRQSVFDCVMRFSHGDAISGGGSTNGLWASVYRRKLMEDQNGRADLDIIGHFHRHSASTREFIINGCLNGASPFGERFSFKHADPVQAFWIWDGKYNTMTESLPIFVE